LVDEFQVGQLAQELHRGYLADAGSAALLRHPYATDLVERLELENTGPAIVPIESIVRKDGSVAFFDLSYAVRNIATGNTYQHVHDRLWLGGALLALGDELTNAGGFDKGPDLQFIRHLRNGVAHGNRFNLRPGQPSLPAHFTGPDQRLLPDGKTTTPPGEAQTFEITPALHGQTVLFDFLGPADVCDLLMFVGHRLIRIGNRDPALPLWPQRP
jgi:hypothetical protein